MDIRFPVRFFNPLVSIHKKYYIEILLYMEKIIEDAKVIALMRSVLLAQLHRILDKNKMFEDVSDEIDYNIEKASGNKLMDDMAFILRYFIQSGWVDIDESDGYSSDLIFITHFGKELTMFLKRLMNQDDQSGYVLNTFNNIKQVRLMPENGYMCIKNAYESTQGLLTSLEMMYSKIKEYYVEQLENTKPEDVLKAHFDGYIHEVIDRVLFPLKVDDSIDRFRGPILDEINEIISDTSLLNQIILLAKQTKRIKSQEDGEVVIFRMLNFMKNQYNNIEEIVAQVDDKNNTYTRITRQKLTYMLSMDTSIKGNLISILSASKGKNEDFWMQFSDCFQLYDVKNIIEDSFHKPRKQRELSTSEPMEIIAEEELTQDEINKVVDSYGAQFTKSKVNSYANELLKSNLQIESSDLVMNSKDDYLMAIFLATNSSDYECSYEFILENGIADIGVYQLPNFSLKEKRGK